MSIFRSILVTLPIMISSAYASEALMVRFSLTEQVKTFLRANEFDVTGVNYDTNEIEALLSPEDYSKLERMKANIKFAYPQNLSMAPDREYKDPEEIEDFIRDIHSRYPSITELKSIGKSLEGRDIWAIKISDNPQVDETEPAILVNAMHHAREIMTPEVTTDMVSYLVENYGTRSDVTSWVDNTEIWVVPMFNVDGNNKMWDGNSMWRKNTRNGHGVDLNRNYPSGWNSCSGSSSSTGAPDYRGPSPASEPETQAMMNLVASIKPVFNISYHSYSEIVIYPYGCRPRKTPTEEAVETIGAEIGAKIKYKPGTAWELLYNADGGDIDWMYTEHQVIPYVIEVNSNMQGFHPSYTKWRDKTVERNRPGWQHLFTRLSGPSLQGVAPSEYHTIKLYKSGASKLSQSYKINPDGSYFIVLNAGTYDVVFEGLENKRFDRMQINSKVSVYF